MSFDLILKQNMFSLIVSTLHFILVLRYPVWMSCQLGFIEAIFIWLKSIRNNSSSNIRSSSKSGCKMKVREAGPTDVCTRLVCYKPSPLNSDSSNWTLGVSDSHIPGVGNLKLGDIEFFFWQEGWGT
jgi:hypothetical protein